MRKILHLIMGLLVATATDAQIQQLNIDSSYAMARRFYPLSK